MAREILVPLKRHDRIEEIVPYIEKIAQPGMKVVFLIRYPVEPWLWFRDHWVTMESPREAMLEGRKIQERYSWDVQRRLAEQRVIIARQALHEKGVEIAVDVYTGSLRRVLGGYTCNGDVQWIMMGAGSGFPVRRLLHGMIPPFGWFKRPSFSPVLLLHHDYLD